MKKSITFFDVNGVQICVLRDLVAALQHDPRHAEQDVGRWRDAKLRHTDAANLWVPDTCKGVRGKPPWLATEKAARSVFDHLT